MPPIHLVALERGVAGAAVEAVGAGAAAGAAD
jgi:hypothetical protein